MHGVHRGDFIADDSLPVVDFTPVWRAAPDAMRVFQRPGGWRPGGVPLRGALPRAGVAFFGQLVCAGRFYTRACGCFNGANFAEMANPRLTICVYE